MAHVHQIEQGLSLRKAAGELTKAVLAYFDVGADTFCEKTANIDVEADHNVPVP